MEKEASFPGGNGAWSKYVTRAITAQLDEFTESDYGTCTVKFVVDKKGVTRFKSVGFGGSDDKLVSELTAMIDMAKEQ